MNLIEGPEAEKHGAATIGVRPEHIDVTGDGPWQGTVGVAEHLGSDTFIHVHGTGLAETLTIRQAGDIPVRHGDAIRLSPRAAEMHRFGKDGLHL